ncbi:hypothetical protein ABBQ38_007141 [Trebouxia sp. C0009 RCD-2024]
MAYQDEEEALSFNVWVAELELLVGNARGNRRVDPIYSFELLQKLQGSIQRSDRAQLHNYQRKCEDALTTVLMKGAPPPLTATVPEQQRLIQSKHPQAAMSGVLGMLGSFEYQPEQSNSQQFAPDTGSCRKASQQVS